MNREWPIIANRTAAVFVWTLICNVFRLVCAPTPAAHGQTRFEFEHPAMGVQFRFVIYADSQTIADRAFEFAAQRATALDGVFSDYKSDSEAMRLVDGPIGRPIEISHDLWTLMRISQKIQSESEGAFDITVGPLTRLWRLARKRHRLPSADEIHEALESVESSHFEMIEPSNVVLKSADLRLDFGGIAKGFAADECLAVFRQMGIESALVAASGDLAIGEPPPGEFGWNIGIATLDGRSVSDRSIRLANCGVSTSSDSLQALEHNGVRYSHIIDPRNGQAVTLHSSVTVVAACATSADAWATALSVLGPERGIELAERRGDFQAMMVSEIEPNQGVQSTQTSGFGSKPADGRR